MNIHVINPEGLLEYVYYSADCALFPTDVGFPMGRTISLTNSAMKITSKISKVPPITIQLLNIISVDSYVSRHPGKFVGGCPFCKVTFRTNSGTENVTIFTTSKKFDAGIMVKLGAQSAMLRLENLVQNNVPFLLCPFLLKRSPNMTTRVLIDQIILNLPQMRFNLSFKNCLWNSSFRNELISHLFLQVETLKAFKLQETTVIERRPLTIEEKLKKIKQVFWVHKRKRKENYPIVPEYASLQPKVGIRDFQNALDDAGNVLLILSNLMIDTPTNDCMLEEWTNSNDLNPLQLVCLLFEICNLEGLPCFKNDSAIDMSLSKAKMRSIKVFWAISSLMKRSKSHYKSFEKIVENDLFSKPAILNMSFKIVTGWTEIYLQSFTSPNKTEYVPNPPLLTTIFLCTLVLSLAQDLNPHLFSKTFKEELVYQLQGFLHQIRYPNTKFPSKTCLMEEFTFRSLALISNYFSVV